MSGSNLLRMAVAATSLLVFGALTMSALALSSTSKQAPAQPVIAASGAYKETLGVSKHGEGSGTVVSDPAGISCGSACSAPFDPNTVVTLTATPAAGSYFQGWHGDCEGSDSAVRKAYVPPTCKVTMDDNHHVGAFFGKGSATSTLTVHKIGSGSGKVTSAPDGIACGSKCANAYPTGINVALTAKAAKGSVLKGWNGNCEGGKSALAKAYVPPTCTIRMDKPHKVNVVFVKAGGGGHGHHGHGHKHQGHKHHGHKHGGHKHHGHKHHHHGKH